LQVCITNYLIVMSDSRRRNDLVPISLGDDPFLKDPFFSSTWDDFDKMRGEMMSEQKDFWNRMDKDFANFDDVVKSQHDDMYRQGKYVTSNRKNSSRNSSCIQYFRVKNLKGQTTVVYSDVNGALIFDRLRCCLRCLSFHLGPFRTRSGQSGHSQ
jgi:hypothetical protein